MSVVGFTFGNAANASRPTTASAASAATTREHPRGWLLAFVPREAGRESESEQDERGQLPAHGASSAPVLSGLRAVSWRRCRAALARRPREQRGPAGHARDLGREVAAAGEHLARRAVRDHHALAEQDDAIGERGGELRVVRGHHHRRSGLGELAGARGQLVLVDPVHPRVGSSSSTTAAGSPASTTSSARRWRSPPERSRGLAASRPGQAGVGHARHAGVIHGVVVHEVVARVLEQQRHRARALDAPARRLGQPLREAQQRALARTVAAHQRHALARMKLEVDAAQDRRARPRFRTRAL